MGLSYITAAAWRLYSLRGDKAFPQTAPTGEIHAFWTLAQNGVEGTDSCVFADFVTKKKTGSRVFLSKREPSGSSLVSKEQPEGSLLDRNTREPVFFFVTKSAF